MRIFNCSAAALAALLFCAISSVAQAQQLPAVSALNGKVEFDAGVLSLPSPAFLGRVAGTLTVPIGDRFGLQADVSIATSPGFTSSAALHAFTRDPASYLIGGTLGVIRTPGATIVALGPEAEGYFDQWTLEAWGGVAVAHPTGSGAARVAPFAMADIAYYPTEDARVSLGLSSLDGYNSVQLAGEYLFEQFDAPISLTAETRLGQDGAWRVMGGLRVYFGGETKSLIRRHREDDPSDRSAALYAAASGKSIANRSTTPSSSPPPDDGLQSNPTPPADAVGPCNDPEHPPSTPGDC